jgi:predicted short-subunit dehydrogenase-like oxidoreductase (DUF2520 family)
MQTLAIFGAGRLGKSLGRLAQRSGRYRVTRVCCRNESAARRAVDFIGAGVPTALDAPLELADVNLLSVPDDALSGLALRLAARSAPVGALAFHASGVMDSAVLAPLAAQGLACGSLHPAFSFAEPARAVETFAGTLCALEGDAPAMASLSAFADAVGGRAFALKPGSKAAYHASLAIASNFLVTLTGFAQSVAAQAGIDDDCARLLLGNLMHQSLDNALSLGAAAALTGPIVRGDVTTVERHLAVLTAPRQAALYRALGRATLALAAQRIRADDPRWLRLSALLEDRAASGAGACLPAACAADEPIASIASLSAGPLPSQSS